jgi:DNA-binding response OmpR family regulator
LAAFQVITIGRIWVITEALDIHLPKHDGLELLAAIRRAPPMAHVTVLVIGASPTPQQRARINELGACYVEKPGTFDGLERLAERVRKRIRQQPR